MHGTQNYSSSYFVFENEFLYAVFDADHQCLLRFLIRQGLCVEIRRTLRRRNLFKKKKQCCLAHRLSLLHVTHRLWIFFKCDQ